MPRQSRKGAEIANQIRFTVRYDVVTLEGITLICLISILKLSNRETDNAIDHSTLTGIYNAGVFFIKYLFKKMKHEQKAIRLIP